MITVTKTQLPPIEEFSKYLEKIWKNKWVTNNGDLVQELEAKLKEYLGVKNLVLVSNCTSGLQIALKAIELKGEIITTPFTFAATTNTIVWEGLTPVFADIDPLTYNIDPNEVEKKITDKTSAILAVHVYGNPCDTDNLQKIASKHGLKLIYDAAHAFCVEQNGRSVLDAGDISVLSFHATKIFHTIEGGAIICDDSIKDRIKLLRNHGIASENKIVLPGLNAKMNELQAAMGLCNLKYVDEKISIRKKMYEHYKEALSGLPITFQSLVTDKYNYSYMPILFNDAALRDTAYSTLYEAGIHTRKYFYPISTNFDYLKINDIDLVEKYNLNNALNISKKILCLPLYPGLETENIDKVTSIVRNIA